jgi:Methylamine utilisation protein MauE
VPVDALISAPFIVATVFVASAVGKLADPRRAAQAFDALNVPRSLARPWIRTAHPWAELVIALCLLITSGIPAVVTAIATTTLAVAYLVLIVQALQGSEPTDCACFGVGRAERVSRRTVLRSICFLVLSGASVWVSLYGRSPLQWAAEAGPDVWWLAALAVAAMMTALILHPSTSKSAMDTEESNRDMDPDDYERTEIPHVPVTMADGTVLSLRELAGSRPKLVIAVSGTCSSCLLTIEAADQWRRRLPEVDIHLLYASANDPTTATPSEPQKLYDPQRFAYEALRLRGTPSAVLLGADGMLAGGPVAGHDNISTFVADVEAELAGARLLAK